MATYHACGIAVAINEIKPMMAKASEGSYPKSVKESSPSAGLGFLGPLIVSQKLGSSILVDTRNAR